MLHGTLLSDLAYSGRSFALGFALAAVAGVLLGVIVGWYRKVELLTGPFLNALYATPRIAMIPLIIIWFGIGMISKVIVVFKITAVAIILNTAAGIKNLDPVWLELARSLRLSRWETTYKIRFPGALPYIITGMRLGVGRALLGVVVAELMAANAGLGYLLRDSSETWDSPKLFVTVILLATIGLVSFNLIKRLEQKMAPWRQSAERTTE